jgi:hypothetical protein
LPCSGVLYVLARCTVARLDDSAVSELLERLAAGESAVTQLADAEGVRHKLSGLCAGEQLGSLITQQVAAYLQRPVRCTTSQASEPLAAPTYYVGRSEGLTLWLAADSKLVCALADAMIGGDGDSGKPAVAGKVARVASYPIQKMLASIAEQLDLEAPASVQVDPAARKSPSGGGKFFFGPHEYHWQVGIDASSRARKHQSHLEAALEDAREICARLLQREVAFANVQVERLASSAMPQAWLRLGVPVPGGTVVLAADREVVPLFLNCVVKCGKDQIRDSELGRIGAETILTDMLFAFISSLERVPARNLRAVGLSDDAILAASPHLAIVHDVELGSTSGRLRWLIPVRETQAP